MNKISCLVVMSIVLSLVALIPIKGKADTIEGDCGDNIEVVDSYPAPFIDFTGGSVHGLAFDGKNLWAAEANSADSKIHKLGFNETGDMIVENSYNVPTNATGTTFVGKNIYCGSDPPTLLIYKIQTKGNNAGKIKGMFNAPGGDCTGLAFVRGHLYNADFTGGGQIHKIKINGDLISSFQAPGNSPEGLAFDGEFLWNVDWDASEIYKLSTDGTLQCTWSWGEVETNHPIGLTFDGNYLWLSDQGTQEIYKIDITPSP